MHLDNDDRGLKDQDHHQPKIIIIEWKNIEWPISVKIIWYTP